MKAWIEANEGRDKNNVAKTFIFKWEIYMVSVIA